LNRLSGPVPWTQRLVAILVWTVGLAIAAGVLVFGFFVGAALLGVAAIAGLIAWARLRWGKPVIPRRAAAAARTGETIIDAEYVVIRREQR
jgi:hypothetical protein